MTKATKERAENLGYTEEEVQEFFDYLDTLRKSGVTNMSGAGPYLQAEFDMERTLSHKVLDAWMKDFSS